VLAVRVSTFATPAPGWIHSPAYDLSLLLLAPLIGVPFLLATPDGPSRLGLLACGFLGVPHYLSTFAFYLWDENSAYHHQRWGSYFAGPILILVTFVTLLFLGWFGFLATGLFFWNVVHVSRQSGGIVSIIRHRAGLRNPPARDGANAAILLVSLWLSLANIETHRQAYSLMTAVSPELPGILRLGLGGAAVLALVRLGVSLTKRAASGEAPAAPEALALLCGLLLFHPYLWIGDSAKATLGMLLGHFLQYLALVWLLHRRRFPEVVGSAAQRALCVVSADLRVLLAVAAIAGAGVTGAFLLCVRLGTTGYFQAAFQMFVFLHFYLDGLFWAFKDPHVRRLLGPYLATDAMHAAARA
jgi:hypothetical protein